MDGMINHVAGHTNFSAVGGVGTALGAFTVEGSFYGDAQQEAGGIFSFTDDAEAPGYACYLQPHRRFRRRPPGQLARLVT